MGTWWVRGFPLFSVRSVKDLLDPKNDFPEMVPWRGGCPAQGWLCAVFYKQGQTVSSRTLCVYATAPQGLCVVAATLCFRQHRRHAQALQGQINVALVWLIRLLFSLVSGERN